MSNLKLKLQILTPEKNFFEGEVDMVRVKAITGEMGILPRHLAIATVLDVGVIKIKNGDAVKKATINGGFMEVKDSTVSVFTDSAEWPEEIDVERAKQARQRAEEKLKSDRLDKQIDFDRAEFALKRAINRMSVLR